MNKGKTQCPYCSCSSFKVSYVATLTPNNTPVHHHEGTHSSTPSNISPNSSSTSFHIQASIMDRKQVEEEVKRQRSFRDPYFSHPAPPPPSRRAASTSRLLTRDHYTPFGRSYSYGNPAVHRYGGRTSNLSAPMQAMRELEDRLSQLGFLDEASHEVTHEPYDDFNLAEEIMIMEVIFKHEHYHTHH